jgi:subtilase family serine protease
VDIALNGSVQSREWFYSSINVLSGQQPGWVRVAGTSIAAPKMAALVAIAAQVNGGPLGDIKPTLYASSRHPSRAGLYDLTEGCTTANGVTGYCASRGFDLPSGAGSPADTTRLVVALAAARR